MKPRRLVLAGAAGVAVLGAVVVYRAATLPSRQVTVEPAPAVAFDHDAAVERFRKSITIPTVSAGEGQSDVEALAELRALLETEFPLVHDRLERRVVNGSSLLYTWPGKDPAAEAVVLLGHLDVVPVEPGTEDAWTHPPFGGVVADGYVWGRGTLDDKVNVLAQLEAAEVLLGRGFVPERTVYLAFGHDEEIGGREGAVKIAELLASEGVKASLVLDEGMVIVEGTVPGTESVALVGVAEKGYVSLELVATGAGGHSSMPPPDTAVAVLARALVRLGENPLPAHFEPSLAMLYDVLAPEMPFGYRLLLANLWLFEPVMLRLAEAEPGTNASLRTTTAPTMLRGSVKDNVLPTSARAVVNFRIHPRDSIASVIAEVERIVDDPRITVETVGFSSEPSPVSPVDASGYRVLERTIREVFPSSVVAPTLVLGGTDARHYQALGPNVYRFTPMRFGPGDLARLHGIDERLGVEDYVAAVGFYVRLLDNLGDL